MTTLICNFQDIVGAKIKGTVTLSAGEARVGEYTPSVVLRIPTSTKELVEGVATFTNVEPGNATLVLTMKGHSTDFRFTIPNYPETVYLSECIEQVLEYTPPVVSRSVGLIESARDDALLHVAAALSSTVQAVRTTSVVNPPAGTTTLTAPTNPVAGQMHIFEILPTAKTTINVSALGPLADGVPKSLTVEAGGVGMVGIRWSWSKSSWHVLTASVVK